MPQRIGRPDLVEALAFVRERAPERDWVIFDGAVPDDVARAAMGEERLPEAERRYLAHTPLFVVARPGTDVAP